MKGTPNIMHQRSLWSDLWYLLMPPDKQTVHMSNTLGCLEFLKEVWAPDLLLTGTGPTSNGHHPTDPK